jgi:alanine racemase
MKATKAIILTENLRDNIAALRAVLRDAHICAAPVCAAHTARICFPVKANAYGHGAPRIAAEAVKNGIDYLAVANVDEGAELREAGIKTPILVFTIPLPGELDKLARNSLSPLVGSIAQAGELAAAAARAGTVITVHLKIDTGMGRVGCSRDEALPLARYIDGAETLRLGGVATHLARADSREPAALAATAAQLERFEGALAAIRKAGIDPGLVHAANSGAVLLHPESRYDMVRPGIMLYGYTPGTELAGTIALKPLMRLESRIVFIKRLRAGESVSYGGRWTAPRDTYIATLPAGYGDGIRRDLSGKLQVRVRGRLYPQRGTICMDQCMIDLGPEPAAMIGDDAVIFDDAAQIAAQLGTIPYEICCAITARVERVYQ